MRLLRRLVGIPLVVVAASLAGVVAEPYQTPAALSLTPEQMEAFLLKARVVRTRPTGIGVTNSQRATLTDGTLTHDAHVQVVDDFKAVYTTSQFTEVGFRDTYHYNVAAYRLARLLGLDNVPVSVVRTVGRTPASVTWWVDDVMMDEMQRRKRGLNDPDPARGNHYQYRMRVFDELIQNRDRNQGNVLYSSDWKMWLIDHTRAFRLQRTLGNAAILVRIERPLFERLQTLTPDVLARALDPHLGRQGREALLARRDAIVAHFEARIAAAGEDAVLYTYTP